MGILPQYQPRRIERFDEILPDQVAIHRLAGRRHTHEDVLLLVGLESDSLGERRVEQTEAVRIVLLPQPSQGVAAPTPHADGLPFADGVYDEDHRFVEGTGEKPSSGVAFVVANVAHGDTRGGNDARSWRRRCGRLPRTVRPTPCGPV